MFIYSIVLPTPILRYNLCSSSDAWETIAVLVDSELPSHCYSHFRLITDTDCSVLIKY